MNGKMGRRVEIGGTQREWEKRRAEFETKKWQLGGRKIKEKGGKKRGRRRGQNRKGEGRS